MTVIRVLYLPGDDRLRSLVKLALDFVEEVYRDEFLSGLKFVSFDAQDSSDVERAKYIAEREGFGLEPKSSLFYWPHHKGVYVWVPVSKRLKISQLLDIIAHEITHHAFGMLPSKDRRALAMALGSDLGAGAGKLIGRRKESLKLANYVAEIISETTTTYVVYNYFVALEREPKTPIPLSNIRNFAMTRYYILLMYPPRSKSLEMMLSEIYHKLAYEDLPNYRRTIHEMFTKLAKKLPVDVLESDRAKYEILYRSEQII
jgi:hypothetical protein